MHHVSGHTADEIYTGGMIKIASDTVVRETRNGKALVFPEIFVTEFCSPMNRVLFNEKRDANPFFHLFEALWMLAGQEDVAYLNQYNSRIHQYSDDGKTFHAAYGYRWRQAFQVDQLEVLKQALQEKPFNRRTVLQMWHEEFDLGVDSLDLPCNLMCTFSENRYGGALDMTVYNRSNDMIWGAYGANIVHFSMLHEYMAACSLRELGRLNFVTSNMHVYQEVFDKFQTMPDWTPCPYQLGTVNPTRLVTDPRTFDSDVLDFVCEPDKARLYSNNFFNDVAEPLRQVWIGWKEKDTAWIDKNFRRIPHQNDWKLACQNWINRRLKR